jgi:hypothetical protein
VYVRVKTLHARTHDLSVYIDTRTGRLGLFEILLDPSRYARLKRRPFTMPCRPICGYDLKRVHLTCLICRARRVFSGKMSEKVELEDAYTIFIAKRRHLASVKSILLRRLLSICELLAN